MRSLHVLVVDDEAAIRQVVANHVRACGHGVEHVGSGEAALERLERGDIDVALCDVRMPDLSGIEVLRRSVKNGIETTFLMMTAFASVSTAIEAMKAGAHDYLIKPVQGEDIKHRLAQVAEMTGLRDENRRLRSMLTVDDETICHLPSRGALQIERLASKVAATEGTVLITGESGTGKGVIARSIHAQSLRARYPFVQVNCGAIPENLLETEFFGHIRGAFTGADRAKKGLFREADGGTLVLDEIGELPMLLQVKLLHAIEEKQVRPVGSEQARRFDVRFIAATNKNLDELIRQGAFREDLYYRLNVLHIQIPPLRDRREDIAPLVEFFLRSEPQRLGIPGEYTVDDEAAEILMAYGWPGNVRELQNVIDHALIIAESPRIGIADLPAKLSRGGSGGETHAPAAHASTGGTLRDQTRQFELAVIRQAIEAAGGDRQLAARGLGIGLSTLYRKLEDSERGPSG